MMHALNIIRQTYVVTFLLLFLWGASPSHAQMIHGGDWQGMDLILEDGDSLYGSFTNIGSFQIGAGDLVCFSAAQ